MLRYIFIGITAYLLGSINSSVLISKGMYQIDIRTKGSGNAGATNVARVFGLASGLLTLVCDGLKAAAAMFLGNWAGGPVGLSIAGAACLIGHCWPVFFHFKGGKGVTVGAIVALMIDWRVFVTLLGVFVLVFLLSRIVSLCSVAAAFCLPFACLFFGLPLSESLLGAFAAVLVIVQHRSNFVRLLRGEEKKFSLKKKE